MEQPAMQFRLTISFNSRKIDELIMSHTEMTIGRHPDNDLRLEDATVSNRHAILKLDDSGLNIIDCNSTNGTLLNGQLIQDESLHDGDVVIIGKYTLSIETIADEPLYQELDPTLQLGRNELDSILTRINNAAYTHSQSSISIDRKTLNWIAQDESGVWWGFENKPTPGLHGWLDALDGTKILLKQDSHQNTQWRETLQRLK